MCSSNQRAGPVNTISRTMMMSSACSRTNQAGQGWTASAQVASGSVSQSHSDNLPLPRCPPPPGGSHLSSIIH